MSDAEQEPTDDSLYEDWEGDLDEFVYGRRIPSTISSCPCNINALCMPGYGVWHSVPSLAYVHGIERVNFVSFTFFNLV